MQATFRQEMKKTIGFILILPALLWFVVFSAYPIFRSIQLSFYEAGPIFEQFIGFKNYFDILKTERIIKGLINTLQFMIICVPILTVLPLIIALLGFRMKAWIQKSIRFAYYIPMLTAGPVISLVWSWLFRSKGLINFITGTEIIWFGCNPYAFYAISFILITSNLGLAIIIYMAAMAGISNELYDAAQLDGCSQFQEDLYITIPEIRGTIGFIFFIKLVATAQIWQYPFLLTGGGPNYGTTTAVLEIYLQAFRFGKYGYASAVGVIFIIIVGGLAFIQRRFFNGDSND